MSCRHSLANGTCAECYPRTGKIVPDWEGESMDGPGAVPRMNNPTPKSDELVVLELRAALAERDAEVARLRDLLEDSLVALKDGRFGMTIRLINAALKEGQ